MPTSRPKGAPDATPAIPQPVFILTVSLLLSACSRQGIYETAIGLERSSAGLEADTVAVGDLDIAYLRNHQTVNGDTIVMIHGFGANKDNWTRLAGHLTDDFNVYAIDLPGHGESSKPWISAIAWKIRQATSQRFWRHCRSRMPTSWEIPWEVRLPHSMQPTIPAK